MPEIAADRTARSSSPLLGGDGRRTVLALVAAVAVVDVVLLAGTAAFHLWAADAVWADLPYAKWVLIQLSLAREATAASWWASLVLLLGGVAALTWSAAAHGRGEALGRRVAWLVAGLVLVGLSLDEVGALHERMLGDNVAGASDAFQSPGPWLVPVVPAALLLVLAVRRARGRAVGAAAWLGALGALSLTTIGIQERLETFDEEVRPVGWLLLEEGTEVVGGLLVLAAVLLAGVRSSYDFRDLRRLRVRPIVPAAAVGAAWVLGAALFELGLGSTPADDQEGLPQWWFAGTAALAVAAGFAVLARRQARRPAWAVAGVALLLCVHHGSDGTTWIEPMFGGRASAVRAALAAVLGLVALAGVVRAASPAARLAALGVGVAAVLAFRSSATDPLDVVVLSASAVAVAWALIPGSGSSIRCQPGAP